MIQDQEAALEIIYRLKKDEIAKVVQFAGTIILKSGSVWITQENDMQDHILEKNFKRKFKAKDLLIQGLTESELQILEQGETRCFSWLPHPPLSK